MSREDAKKDLYYGIQFDTLKINEFIDKIYDEFEQKFEKEQNSNLENEKAKSIILNQLKKENTRLKKQLANNHHIECMGSFCKPPISCCYVENE